MSCFRENSQFHREKGGTIKRGGGEDWFVALLNRHILKFDIHKI